MEILVIEERKKKPIENAESGFTALNSKIDVFLLFWCQVKLKTHQILRISLSDLDDGSLHIIKKYMVLHASASSALKWKQTRSILNWMNGTHAVCSLSLWNEQKTMKMMEKTSEFIRAR